MSDYVTHQANEDRIAHLDKECQRQSALVVEADKKNISLQKLLNQALEDIDGWTT